MSNTDSGGGGPPDLSQLQENFSQKQVSRFLTYILCFNFVNLKMKVCSLVLLF